MRVHSRLLIQTKIQSESISEPSTPYESEWSFQYEWIRGQNDLKRISNPNNSDHVFIRTEKLIRIQSLGLTHIKSVRSSTDLHHEIKNVFRIDADELRLLRIKI